MTRSSSRRPKKTQRRAASGSTSTSSGCSGGGVPEGPRHLRLGDQHQEPRGGQLRRSGDALAARFGRGSRVEGEPMAPLSRPARSPCSVPRRARPAAPGFAGFAGSFGFGFRAHVGLRDLAKMGNWRPASHSTESSWPIGPFQDTISVTGDLASLSSLRSISGFRGFRM